MRRSELYIMCIPSDTEEAGALDHELQLVIDRIRVHNKRAYGKNVDVTREDVCNSHIIVVNMNGFDVDLTSPVSTALAEIETEYHMTWRYIQ